MQTSHSILRRILTAAALPACCLVDAGAESVARIWNEQNLASIRIDLPNPPVHARNLFHTSAAMWDAWAAYDPVAVGYIHNEDATAADVAAARHQAISYAAYRLLKSRYSISVNAAATLVNLAAQMSALGYDPDDMTDTGPDPVAVGNRVANAILAFADSDGSNEAALYRDFTYVPANEPLILLYPGTSALAQAPLADPNRWQPLAFEVAETQNGLEADKVQRFLGSHWGEVRPFALHREEGEVGYYDPGTPPMLGGPDDMGFKNGSAEIILRSSLLDPDAGTMIDISPGAIGNNPLGTNNGTGYAVNPVTGNPYAPNIVNHGDFGRALAEFWADGPASETPPGHWNTIANSVVEHPDFERRFMGKGPELDPLEWDVKMYFAINAAVHDAAVAAWGCKRNYDYVRPITSIRYMGELGQSTDPGGPSYHVNGLPLIDDLIEVITDVTAAPGGRHEGVGNVGEIAIYAWGGEPADPENEYTGAKWILAVEWMPYQRSTFVTPAFAGYISGHSTFSRAAAEVLTRMTGSAFFPGGMGAHTVSAGGLEFEAGPSADIELQWATYFDASDQAGISRLYGGIHVPVDDGPGRMVGSKCGMGAWNLAVKYFDGSILEEAIPFSIERLAGGDFMLEWHQRRGLFYEVKESIDVIHFFEMAGPERALEDRGQLTVPASTVVEDRGFYQVIRSATGM